MPRAALTDAPKKIFKTIFIPYSFVTLAKNQSNSN